MDCAGVADPGGLFLADRRAGTPGSVVFPSMEGQRPLLVEIQALVVSTPMVSPPPVGTGHRLRPAGVAARSAGAASRVDLARPRGLRLRRRVAPGWPNPGLIWPSAWPWRLGLHRASRRRRRWSCSERSGWEARSARWPQTPRRLAEAARLGFRRALVPDRGPEGLAPNPPAAGGELWPEAPDLASAWSTAPRSPPAAEWRGLR